MRKLLCFFAIISFFSCKSDREKKIEQIKHQSDSILSAAIADMMVSGTKVNSDSLMQVYAKLATDSAELGLAFAKNLSDGVNKIKLAGKILNDSINKIRQDSIAKVNAADEKKWESSKAGKIQKKHPDWSNEDCDRIANNKIWLGMSLDMLKCERGNPNSANPSNYGNGTEWQWCWDNYTPSCFYGGDDGIITSYN